MSHIPMVSTKIKKLVIVYREFDLSYLSKRRPFCVLYQQEGSWANVNYRVLRESHVKFVFFIALCNNDLAKLSDYNLSMQVCHLTSHIFSSRRHRR